MTKPDMERLTARVLYGSGVTGGIRLVLQERILAALKEAVAEEREACAKIANNPATFAPVPLTIEAVKAGAMIFEAIRARSEEAKPDAKK